MANELAPSAPVTLGGKERQLCFNYNAFRIIRQELGVDILKNSDELDNIASDELGIVVYAALTPNDPELRGNGKPGPARDAAIETVCGWLHPGNTHTVVAAVFAAFAACMPKADPDAGDADPNGNGPS